MSVPLPDVDALTSILDDSAMVKKVSVAAAKKARSWGSTQNARELMQVILMAMEAREHINEVASVCV